MRDFSSGSWGDPQPPWASEVLSTALTGLWDAVLGGAEIRGTALLGRDPHFLPPEPGQSWAWACLIALPAWYSVAAETVTCGDQVALGS